METPWRPRRLIVFLAVVAAHTWVLAVLQEEDERRLLHKVSDDNEPAMVWVPPLPDQEAPRASEPAAAPRTHPERTTAAAPKQPASAAAGPGPPQPPSIDWNRELQVAAVDQLARNERRHQQESVFTTPRAPPSLAAAAPRGPQFQWDYAATHRIEHTPGGTLYININDRCLFVFPMLFLCKIGELTPHTHLLDLMREPPPAN